MKKYTDFNTINQMLEESGFVIENQEDFKKIPDDEWNSFIATRTRFDNWKSMMEKAATEYIKNLIES